MNNRNETFGDCLYHIKTRKKNITKYISSDIGILINPAKKIEEYENDKLRF